MLETGDVILKKTNILTKVVGWFTNSEYAHVALVYESPIIVQSHILGVNPWNLCDMEPFDVYRVKGGLTAEEKRELKKELKKELRANRKYDYGQLIGYGYYALIDGENKLNNPKKYICSELVDRVYKNALGYKLAPEKSPGDVTPADLARSPSLYKTGDE